MTTVSVVYHSGKGRTGAIAEAVARGAQSVEGVQVHLIQILPEQIQANGRWQDEEIMVKINASDAIIFGCPTYMGSVSGIFKLFMEATFDLWFQQGWKDKFAAGFTNSASQSGDKLSSPIQLMVFASQLSMIWIPVGDPPGNNWSGGSINDINRLGSWVGVMSQSDGDRAADVAPPESDRLTAERQGRRVASIARRWKGEGEYATEYITTVEVGGAGTLEKSIKSVRYGGRISSIGVLSGVGGEINPQPILGKSITMQGIYVGSREMFEAMNRAIAHHRLKPVIDRTFPFTEAKAAYQYLKSGSHFGKVVIQL